LGQYVSLEGLEEEEFDIVGTSVDVLVGEVKVDMRRPPTQCRCMALDPAQAGVSGAGASMTTMWGLPVVTTP
jgi:hypothetical protein